jgi:hypothetical protein
MLPFRIASKMGGLSAAALVATKVKTITNRRFISFLQQLIGVLQRAQKCDELLPLCGVELQAEFVSLDGALGLVGGA